MSIPTISSAMRFFFSVTSTILWIGIFLTGIDVVHWLLFIPAGFFTVAAVTGICPGIIFSNRLFSKSGNNT